MFIAVEQEDGGGISLTYAKIIVEQYICDILIISSLCVLQKICSCCTISTCLSEYCSLSTLQTYTHHASSRHQYRACATSPS